MGSKRLSREESWKELDIDLILDDPDGWEFTIFKSGYIDADFSNLTLPRTYMGRSLFERTSFHNTDLHDSHMCWNDFIDCDFSEANLPGADLRASIYKRCKFINCCLTGADLRRSIFEECDFMRADMQGAKLTRKQATRLALTKRQHEVIEWQEDDGPEPEGG